MRRRRRGEGGKVGMVGRRWRMFWRRRWRRYWGGGCFYKLP